MSLIVLCEECDSFTGLSGAACTANTMDIILDGERELIYAKLVASISWMGFNELEGITHGQIHD